MTFEWNHGRISCDVYFPIHLHSNGTNVLSDEMHTKSLGGGGGLELRTAAIMYSNNMSCCLLCRAFQISQLWGFTVLLDGHFWPLHSRLMSFAWESCILKMWRSSLKLQLLKSMILYLAFYFHSTDPWKSAAHVGRSKSTRFQNRSKDFAFVKWICSCV